MYNLLFCCILAMVDLFVLEHAPYAFHRGVVVAIPHTHPKPVKQQGIFLGAILTPPIRVVNHTRCGSLGGYGPQGELADQVFLVPTDATINTSSSITWNGFTNLWGVGLRMRFMSKSG